MEVEPLIAIPTFIHDFLCIHPFNDGNGRMSRLLTTLLLYRNGFYVGKYISLEAKIAKNKALYYDALGQAQTGWHEGTEDVVPFIKYLLGTILAAYKDFEDRFALVETKLPALETVRRATMNKIGRFTKQDIRELCPFQSCNQSTPPGPGVADSSADLHLDNIIYLPGESMGRLCQPVDRDGVLRSAGIGTPGARKCDHHAQYLFSLIPVQTIGSAEKLQHLCSDSDY